MLLKPYPHTHCVNHPPTPWILCVHQCNGRQWFLPRVRMIYFPFAVSIISLSSEGFKQLLIGHHVNLLNPADESLNQICPAATLTVSFLPSLKWTQILYLIGKIIKHMRRVFRRSLEMKKKCGVLWNGNISAFEIILREFCTFGFSKKIGHIRIFSHEYKTSCLSLCVCMFTFYLHKTDC